MITSAEAKYASKCSFVHLSISSTTLLWWRTMLWSSGGDTIWPMVVWYMDTASTSAVSFCHFLREMAPSGPCISLLYWFLTEIANIHSSLMVTRIHCSCSGVNGWFSFRCECFSRLSEFEVRSLWVVAMPLWFIHGRIDPIQSVFVLEMHVGGISWSVHQDHPILVGGGISRTIVRKMLPCPNEQCWQTIWDELISRHHFEQCWQTIWNEPISRHR